MNVEDWRRAPLDEIVFRIGVEAEARGVAVAGVGARRPAAARGAAAAGGREALGLPTLD